MLRKNLQKFAFVLFFAMIQATIGSFVIFLTLTDCIGPARPTYLADKLIERCRGKPTETGVGNADSTHSKNAQSLPAAAPVDLMDDISDEIEV